MTRSGVSPGRTFCQRDRALTRDRCYVGRSWTNSARPGCPVNVVMRNVSPPAEDAVSLNRGGQAVLVGVSDGLGPVAGAGLGEDPVDVGSDRGVAQAEALADLGVAQPEASSVSTSASRAVSPPGGFCPGPGTVSPSAGARLRTAVTRRSCTAGSRWGLPGVDRVDRSLDLLGAGVLGQVTPRSPRSAGMIACGTADAVTGHRANEAAGHLRRSRRD